MHHFHVKKNKKNLGKGAPSPDSISQIRPLHRFSHISERIGTPIDFSPLLYANDRDNHADDDDDDDDAADPAAGAGVGLSGPSSGQHHCDQPASVQPVSTGRRPRCGGPLLSTVSIIQSGLLSGRIKRGDLYVTATLASYLSHSYSI